MRGANPRTWAPPARRTSPVGGGEECPACSGEGRALSLVVEGRYRLFRCSGCGTQFFRQSVATESEDGNSAYWEAHKFAFYEDPATRAAFARRYGRILGDAHQLIGPIRTVLDVGCGTGNFLDYAQSRGLDAYGIDLDAGAVAQARSRGLNAFTQGELGSTELPERFDAMTMWDVIEHIIDPLAALKTLLPRVRTGGALLFETPDGGFPLRPAILGVHRLSRGRYDYTRPLYYWEHKIYFTERGFRALMQRLGCEIVDLRRGTSVQEKMNAIFAFEAQRTGSRSLATLRRTFPVLAGAAERANVGNKLLVVARVN